MLHAFVYDTELKLTAESSDKNQTCELPDKNIISVGAGGFCRVERLFHDTSFSTSRSVTCHCPSARLCTPTRRRQLQPCNNLILVSAVTVTSIGDWVQSPNIPPFRGRIRRVTFVVDANKPQRMDVACRSGFRGQ